MTRISPSMIPEDDPRFPIWGRLWRIRIPKIATYSTEYLEQVGLPTSGFKDVDIAIAKNPIPVWITINDMVEYYHEGTVVRIIKQKDVKEIYEICQRYTFDAAERIRTQLYTATFPFEDLIKIDEFSEAVYQYAADEYGIEFIRTFVSEDFLKQADDLQSMFDAVDKRMKNRDKARADKYTVDNKFSPLAGTRLQQKTHYAGELKEIPARPSVRDLFLAYVQNGTGSRL